MRKYLLFFFMFLPKEALSLPYDSLELYFQIISHVSMDHKQSGKQKKDDTFSERKNQKAEGAERATITLNSLKKIVYEGKLNRDDRPLLSANRKNNIFFNNVMENAELIYAPPNKTTTKIPLFYKDKRGLNKAKLAFGQVNNNLKDKIEKGLPFTLFIYKKEGHEIARHIAEGNASHLIDAYHLWQQQYQVFSNKAAEETFKNSRKANATSLIDMFFQIADLKSDSPHTVNIKGTKSLYFFDSLFLVDSDFFIYKGDITVSKLTENKSPIEVREKAILAVHRENRFVHKAGIKEYGSPFLDRKVSKDRHRMLSYLFVLPHTPKKIETFIKMDDVETQAFSRASSTGAGSDFEDLNDLLDVVVQKLENEKVETAHILLAKYSDTSPLTQAGEKDSKLTVRPIIYSSSPDTTKQQHDRYAYAQGRGQNSTNNSTSFSPQLPPISESLTEEDDVTLDSENECSSLYFEDTLSDTVDEPMESTPQPRATARATEGRDDEESLSIPALFHGFKAISERLMWATTHIERLILEFRDIIVKQSDALKAENNGSANITSGVKAMPDTDEQTEPSLQTSTAQWKRSNVKSFTLDQDGSFESIDLIYRNKEAFDSSEALSDTASNDDQKAENPEIISGTKAMILTVDGENKLTPQHETAEGKSGEESLPPSGQAPLATAEEDLLDGEPNAELEPVSTSFIETDI